MKRQIKNYKIKRIYPFIFWKKCCKCGQEFKREYGWKISLRNRCDIEASYLCNECAKTESEVEDMLENNVFAKQIIVPIGGSSRMIKPIEQPCPCKPPIQKHS